MHAPGFPKLLLLLSLLITNCWSAAGYADTPVRVTLGTATKGGGFQLYGEHLAQVINGADNGLRVETVASRGSRQNLQWLHTGEIDMGLVEGNAAHQAMQGEEPIARGMKVLSVMYPNAGMFVVRADSPYQRIEDLRGKPVAFGTRASGLRILAADVLDGMGLDPQRDFAPVILDKAADGPRLLLEKKVEALWGAGIGWPGFVRLADSPGGARFIAPSAEQVKQILAKHGHLKPMPVPAGSYTGQHRQIDSVGLWSLLLSRPGLPDETGYRLAQALHRGEHRLAQQLTQGGFTTAKNTLLQVPTERLHPGVQQYFRDSGLLKD